MAYDPVKAHEYYVNYRKKGLKKGRKKAAAQTSAKTTKKKGKGSKKAKTESLVGLSTAGLNDEGKMQFAILKKDLQAQMNAELAKAKTDAEKASIRAEYQAKALKAVQEMKADPQYAKPAKAKSGSGSKSSGTGSGAGSRSSGSGSSSSSGSSSGSSGSSGGSGSSSQAAQNLARLNRVLEKLTTSLSQMPLAKRSMVRDILESIADVLGTQFGVDAARLKKLIDQKLSS